MRVNRKYSMVMVLGTCIWTTLITLSFAQHVLGEEPDAHEIVMRMDSLLRGDSSRGVYRMEVIAPDWSRMLEMKYWTLGREKSMVLITAPVKEKGISFLRVKTEVWNYLPNIERTIKIPPSMMMQSWMGSDFTNDDLVKESSIVHDYDQKIVAEEEFQGFETYQCELFPKPDAPVVWGKIRVWIRKNDYVPLREEYFDEDGTLINVLLFDGIQEMGGRVIPTILTMIPQNKKGHKTVMTIEKADFNIPIKETFFGLKNIKRLR